MPDEYRRSRLADSSPETFAAALGELLIERNYLDKMSLSRGRRVAEETGSRLDAVLTQLGLVNDRALAEAMASLLGLTIADPAAYPKAPILPDRLRTKFLRKARTMPIALTDSAVTVAMVDPLDRFSISAIGVAAGREVRVQIAVPIDLEAAFERLYLKADSADSVGTQDFEISAAADSEQDAERLKDLASEAPLIRLVNQIISQAVESRASDVHIDALPDRVRLRYRYDGVLHEVEAPPARLRAAIVSRIKIMARLDIAEQRMPQDGRIKLVVRGHEIDLRVSTIPSLHGESVVLRILDRSVVRLDFGVLGLDDKLCTRLRQLLEVPNGILLVTGPTGSGKTTTLYTSLLSINSVDRNIVTVEDPIEYELAGITQTQVKPQIGLNFASSLRSILRHDPDVIMIGEIRDAETAQIAVQAALTGHLVLSTLHTNNAAATITRLRDMGLEDYLLTATLNGVVAQRLVRRLCSACKRPVRAPPELIDRYRLDRFDHGSELVLFEPGGCVACRSTGYVGRLAVGELLEPDEKIRQLILARADHGSVQSAACAAGMRTMYEDGLARVLDGITSLSEVLRSLRIDE
jgi:general secretion pathway protein E